jgi:hypothetical protein
MSKSYAAQESVGGIVILPNIALGEGLNDPGLVWGAMIRAATIAKTMSRSRHGLEAIMPAKPRRCMVSATASTAPCERERVTSNAWASGTKIVPCSAGANDLDQVIGQMREIAERLGFDDAALAVTAPQ